MKRRSQFAVAIALALAATVTDAQHIRNDRPERRRPGPQTKNDKAPKAGEVAPAFELKSLDRKRTVDLAGFKGKRPVILFFGSYT